VEEIVAVVEEEIVAVVEEEIVAVEEEYQIVDPKSRNLHSYIQEVLVQIKIKYKLLI